MFHEKLVLYAVSIRGHIETLKVKELTNVFSVSTKVCIYNISATHVDTYVCTVYVQVKSSLGR